MFQLILTSLEIFVGASQLASCTAALFVCVCLFVPGLLNVKHYAWLGMLHCIHETRGLSNEVLMRHFA